MLILFALSKCIVTLNKRIMKSKLLHSKNDDGGHFKTTDYVLTVLLCQGAKFNSNKTDFELNKNLI